MLSTLHRNTNRDKPLFLTDGGLETTLIYHEGWELPEFAAFPLLASSSGRNTLANYYRRYLSIAEKHKTGFVLATPTWRASQNWGEKLGFTTQELDRINQDAVSFVYDVASEFPRSVQKNLVVSGQIGPCEDGYAPRRLVSTPEAEDYHRPQVRSFAKAMVDQIDALTLTHVEEAIALCHLASDFDLPIVPGFTVETNGCLPSGLPLREAIEAVDDATGKAAAYYMVNCAHPDHIAPAVAGTGQVESWLNRIGAIRANASRLSHAELDQATELDDGDPQEFADLLQDMQARLPNLWVVGGCCGTDHRHIEALCQACATRCRTG